MTESHNTVSTKKTEAEVNTEGKEHVWYAPLNAHLIPPDGKI